MSSLCTIRQGHVSSKPDAAGAGSISFSLPRTYHLWPLVQTWMKGNIRTNVTDVTNTVVFNLLEMLLSCDLRRPL